MFIEISMNTLLKNSPLWHFWDVDGQKPWYCQYFHEKQSQKNDTPLAFYIGGHKKNATPLAFLEIDIKKRQPLSWVNFFIYAWCRRNAIF